jgi:hypothetical protein
VAAKSDNALLATLRTVLGTPSRRAALRGADVAGADTIWRILMYQRCKIKTKIQPFGSRKFYRALLRMDMRVQTL